MHQQFQNECIHLLEQSLDRIRHCIGQLSEQQIWWRPGPDLNSIGILLRHLAGNLQQWAVDGVCGTENNRDREAEFESQEKRAVEQLLDSLSTVVDQAKEVIRSLSADDLIKPRTIQGFDVSVMGALMHTLPHFVGHTHQIVQMTRMQLQEGYQFHWEPDGQRDKVPI